MALVLISALASNVNSINNTFCSSPLLGDSVTQKIMNCVEEIDSFINPKYKGNYQFDDKNFSELFSEENKNPYLSFTEKISGFISKPFKDLCNYLTTTNDITNKSLVVNDEEYFSLKRDLISGKHHKKKIPSVFFTAIYKREVNTVRFLLSHYDIDINATDIYGQTALHFACMNVSEDSLMVILALLEYGGDLYAKDKYGETPYDLLCTSPKIKNIIQSESLKTIESPIDLIERPNALFLIAYYDHNGVFEETKPARTYLSEFYNSNEYYIYDEFHLKRVLKKHRKDFLDLIYIMAHGSPESIQLSKDDDFEMRHDYYEDPELQEVLLALKPGGTIVLHSCSTAAEAEEENFASYILRHAPENTTMFAGTKPIIGENGIGLDKFPRKDQKLEITFFTGSEYSEKDIIGENITWKKRK